MALRSDARAAGATSGPGRGPASDGRSRHRRSLRSPGPGRHRHAPPQELRRRAEALFGDVRGGAAEAEAEAEAGRPEAPDPAATWRERAGPALRERLPVWWQTRCGVERRGVAALAVLLVAGVLFAAQHFWTGRTEAVPEPEVVREVAAAPRVSASVSPSAGAGAGVRIVVDVGGRVRRPGIHRLPSGSRVEDALRAAGGVRPGTKTDGLNRARFLVDGEQVIVGASAPPPAPGAAVGTSGGAGGPGAGPPAASVPLSTATVDQLETLPGVGPVLAQHIVDYRTRHGGFRSVDELREVNGIGERRFADLRSLVQP
ncbi:helix-hairpin-helix domain-containing protein [Streptomyces sp. NPDC048182]|uniref:helix-hairpin-helix domain-containing protein n=1 Tax=Streptomyces sp. NPDC048182 TaxID=3365507 RepID=UPI003714429D